MRTNEFELIVNEVRQLPIEFEYNSFDQLYDDVMEQFGDESDEKSYISNSYISHGAIENWIGEMDDFIDKPDQMDTEDRWVVNFRYGDMMPLKLKNTLQILMVLYASTRYYSIQRSGYVRRSMQLFRFRVLYEMMCCFSSNICAYLPGIMKRQLNEQLEGVIGKTFHELYCNLLKYGRGMFGNRSWVPSFHSRIAVGVETGGYTDRC